MLRKICFFAVVATIVSCASKKPTTATSSPIEHQAAGPVQAEKHHSTTSHQLAGFFEETENKFQDQTGFMLYDPQEKKIIHEYHSDRYFTPGSNTKIFTFYTALRTVGDSVPALKYVEKNDSLIFWGTGDASFLYKFTFNNFRTFNFLKNAKSKLYFSSSNFYSAHFGKGWAWDDYNDSYSAERSPFPVFGNIFTVTRTGSLLTVQPPYFDNLISIGERKKKEEVKRDLHSNDFQFCPGLTQPQMKQWDVPMKTDAKLTVKLLSDTLRRDVFLTHKKLPLPPATKHFYSIPTDSLYAELMQNSDNFIAEELLLMCGGIVRDSLNAETAIRYSLENYLGDLPDKPVWIDGSGLSRYNLFTVRTIVRVWEKIFELVPKDRLFSLLATGGVSGTIKKWYKADEPYIFGKTGTLSNNHALSGFIVTRSGKILIFAFMNNNYVATTNDIRTNMQDLLVRIRDNY